MNLQEFKHFYNTDLEGHIRTIMRCLPTEWPTFTTPSTPTANKNIERQDCPFIVTGAAEQCHRLGSQFGYLLQNEAESYYSVTTLLYLAWRGENVHKESWTHMIINIFWIIAKLLKIANMSLEGKWKNWQNLAMLSAKWALILELQMIRGK